MELNNEICVRLIDSIYQFRINFSKLVISVIVDTSTKATILFIVFGNSISLSYV